MLLLPLLLLLVLQILLHVAVIGFELKSIYLTEAWTALLDLLATMEGVLLQQQQQQQQLQQQQQQQMHI
ncbi:hypothetical protein AWZ03_004147 [Drosophila navojoa]|uniref:Uncharacterized protein n=1 Tax=Drosophila navojoa TaxID=7232 RepID=A0A484BLB1_DRONA|nr:hypothetical protein AWZ03_004147 [Drosophila navojoa]